jgi:hypothetical protein
LAFRSARIRIGADRFELSFANPLPLVVTLLLLATTGLPLSLALADWRAALLVLVPVLALVASSRTKFVVTAETSMSRHSVLGIPWRRRRLGRHPEVKLDGWSWNEIAIHPSDPALRRGLHDDEREVLVDWNDGDVARNRDAERLIQLARAEVQRLHGES